MGPETKIKNRFSVLSDLVLKPKTQTETSSSSSSVSSNSTSSSSYSPVKAQATKNKPQQNKPKTKIKFNKLIKIREFDEKYHGFSDSERLASIKTSKTINKGNEEEEKRE